VILFGRLIADVDCYCRSLQSTLTHGWSAFDAVDRAGVVAEVGLDRWRGTMHVHVQLRPSLARGLRRTIYLK
jgi:hypothetical protein